jgi:hypothetical protein
VYMNVFVWQLGEGSGSERVVNTWMGDCLGTPVADDFFLCVYKDRHLTFITFPVHLPYWPGWDSLLHHFSFETYTWILTHPAHFDSKDGAACTLKCYCI